MSRPTPLQIPAGARIDVVEGGLAIQSDGDIVLHGEHTFVEVVSEHGDIIVEGSLTCTRVVANTGSIRITGALRCDEALAPAGDVQLAGTIEARLLTGDAVALEGTVRATTIRGGRIQFAADLVEAKGVQATEAVQLAAASYTVEVVLAPRVEIDAAASGRINVLECHNVPSKNGLKGKFRLGEYAEFTGVEPAEFLAERGVEPLPDRGLTEDVTAPVVRSVPEPIAPEPIAPEAAVEEPAPVPEEPVVEAAEEPAEKPAAPEPTPVPDPVFVPEPTGPLDAVTDSLPDPFTGPIPDLPEDPFADPAGFDAIDANEVEDGTRRLDFDLPDDILEDAPPEEAPLLPPNVVAIHTDELMELDMDSIESLDEPLDEPDSQLEIIDEDSMPPTPAPLVLDESQHRELQSSIDQLSAAYPQRVPPQVARLRTLVNQSEYRLVRDELPDLFNELLREHLASSNKPQHRVFTGFQRINEIVKAL